jgi:hypothetical protein
MAPIELAPLATSPNAVVVTQSAPAAVAPGDIDGAGAMARRIRFTSWFRHEQGEVDMASDINPTGIDRETFGGMLDRSGLALSDAQKSTLFEIYPMFLAMIARASAPMPREAEPSVIFVPEVK